MIKQLLRILPKIRSLPGRLKRRQKLDAIFGRFRDLTMIQEKPYLDNLSLAESIRDIPGCVVECGVWRGGMIAGIAAMMGRERSYYLFDSFEGLPPAGENDGSAAIEWQRNPDASVNFNNCTAPIEAAAEAMRLSGAREFHLCKGWFNETLPAFVPPCPIALLRLDGDWYDSTMVCLDCLFDHVAPGGLIVVDDYLTWDGCSRALHDFLSRRSALERIHIWGTVCYLIKKPATYGR